MEVFANGVGECVGVGGGCEIVGSGCLLWLQCLLNVQLCHQNYYV